MDHAALVQLGVRWLRQVGCRTVLAEPHCIINGESPDVIGWQSNGTSIVIEAKSNRVDFRDDWRPDRKPFRHNPALGMGSRRYYVCPPGVATLDDVVVHGWGLLVVYSGRIFNVVDAAHQVRNAEAELHLLARVARNEESVDQLELPGMR